MCRRSRQPFRLLDTTSASVIVLSIGWRRGYGRRLLLSSASSLTCLSAFSLPSSICLRNSLADLILSLDRDVVQVDAIKKTLLEDLAHNFLLDFLGVDLGRAQERAKARLMFDLPLSLVPRACQVSSSACRACISPGRAAVFSVPSRSTFPASRFSASFSSSAISRGVQKTGVGVRDADFA